MFRVTMLLTSLCGAQAKQSPKSIKNTEIATGVPTSVSGLLREDEKGKIIS